MAKKSKTTKSKQPEKQEPNGDAVLTRLIEWGAQTLFYGELTVTPIANDAEAGQVYDRCFASAAAIASGVELNPDTCRNLPNHAAYVNSIMLRFSQITGNYPANLILNSPKMMEMIIRNFQERQMAHAQQEAEQQASGAGEQGSLEGSGSPSTGQAAAAPSQSFTDMRVGFGNLPPRCNKPN